MLIDHLQGLIKWNDATNFYRAFVIERVSITRWRKARVFLFSTKNMYSSKKDKQRMFCIDMLINVKEYVYTEHSWH